MIAGFLLGPHFSATADTGNRTQVQHFGLATNNNCRSFQQYALIRSRQNVFIPKPESFQAFWVTSAEVAAIGPRRLSMIPKISKGYQKKSSYEKNAIKNTRLYINMLWSVGRGMVEFSQMNWDKNDRSPC